MEKVERVYRLKAREFIDSLFDKGYFAKEIKRADMRAVESLLGFLFQSKVNIALKGQELLRKVREATK